MTTATTDPLEIDTVTGRVVVPPSDLIQMVQPMPGFEACRRYVLIAAPELAPFTCLHGVDTPQPVFVTIDPHLVDPDYHVTLGPAERRRLGAVDDEPLLWLAPVRIDDTGATANLRAPIVVHPARMVALQFLGADSTYSTAHPLPGR
ncbi:MAG: flagellar assembly protein FliW [Vicinamibacterales bacterium]